MDIGGFRDMHRHRRCTQIIQGFTSVHGFESPGSGDLAADVDITRPKRWPSGGAPGNFTIEAMADDAARIRIAAGGAALKLAQSAFISLIPLATRIRSRFSKWTLRKRRYISEDLRFRPPAGHFSYRRVAWEMYLALRAQHPSIARHIRVTDFTKPIDMLQR